MSGELTFKVDVMEGLDSAAAPLERLSTGAQVGKRLVCRRVGVVRLGADALDRNPLRLALQFALSVLQRFISTAIRSYAAGVTGNSGGLQCFVVYTG